MKPLGSPPRGFSFLVKQQRVNRDLQCSGQVSGIGKIRVSATAEPDGDSGFMGSYLTSQPGLIQILVNHGVPDLLGIKD
jgi:hypothetical protein